MVTQKPWPKSPPETDIKTLLKTSEQTSLPSKLPSFFFSTLPDRGKGISISIKSQLLPKRPSTIIFDYLEMFDILAWMRTNRQGKASACNYLYETNDLVFYIKAPCNIETSPFLLATLSQDKKHYRIVYKSPTSWLTSRTPTFNFDFQKWVDEDLDNLPPDTLQLIINFFTATNSKKIHGFFELFLNSFYWLRQQQKDCNLDLIDFFKNYQFKKIDGLSLSTVQALLFSKKPDLLELIFIKNKLLPENLNSFSIYDHIEQKNLGNELTPYFDIKNNFSFFFQLHTKTFHHLIHCNNGKPLFQKINMQTFKELYRIFSAKEFEWFFTNPSVRSAYNSTEGQEQLLNKLNNLFFYAEKNSLAAAIRISCSTHVASIKIGKCLKLFVLQANNFMRFLEENKIIFEGWFTDLFDLFIAIIPIALNFQTGIIEDVTVGAFLLKKMQSAIEDHPLKIYYSAEEFSDFLKKIIAVMIKEIKPAYHFSANSVMDAYEWQDLTTKTCKRSLTERTQQLHKLLIKTQTPSSPQLLQTSIICPLITLLKNFLDVSLANTLRQEVKMLTEEPPAKRQCYGL